jgi:hypothetical protein
MRAVHRFVSPIGLVLHRGCLLSFGRPVEEAQLRVAKQYHASGRCWVLRLFTVNAARSVPGRHHIDVIDDDNIDIALTWFES